MQAYELRNLCDPILHAASRDVTRESITRVLLSPESDGSLVAVATDGHRLCLSRQANAYWPSDVALLASPAALKSLPATRKAGGFNAVSVSGKPGVYRLQVNGFEEETAVECFQVGENGYAFPNYAFLFPAERKISGALTVSDDALEQLKALGRVVKCGRVECINDSEAHVIVQTGSGFSARLVLGWEGERFDPTGFTVKYLADALGFASHKTLCAVQWQADLKPVLFGFPDQTCVLMPARL